MIGGKMFWKKKKKFIDKKSKRHLLSELKALKNQALFMNNECDKIMKYIEELK
tara:strand:- start:808 stop:966 length:159 start_codon:yes stop_codon:yes gene_type:complete